MLNISTLGAVFLSGGSGLYLGGGLGLILLIIVIVVLFRR